MKMTRGDQILNCLGVGRESLHFDNPYAESNFEREKVKNMNYSLLDLRTLIPRTGGHRHHGAGAYHFRRLHRFQN